MGPIEDRANGFGSIRGRDGGQFYSNGALGNDGEKLFLGRVVNGMIGEYLLECLRKLGIRDNCYWIGFEILKI